MQQKIEKLTNNIINPSKQNLFKQSNNQQQQQQQQQQYYTNYPPQPQESNKTKKSNKITQPPQQYYEPDEDLMYDTIVPDNIGVYKRINNNNNSSSSPKITTTNINGGGGNNSKPQRMSDKLSMYYNEDLPKDEHYESLEEDDEDLYTTAYSTTSNSNKNKSQYKSSSNNINSLYENNNNNNTSFSTKSNNGKNQQQLMNPSQSLSEPKKQLNTSSTTYMDYNPNMNMNGKNNNNNSPIKVSSPINNNNNKNNNNNNNSVKEIEKTTTSKNNSGSKSNKKSSKSTSSPVPDFDSDLADDFDDFVEIEEKAVDTICQLYYIHFYQTPEMIRNETQKWLEERWFLPANFKDIKWNQPNRFFFPVYVFTIVTTTFFDATFTLNDFTNTISRQKITSTHEEIIFCASNSMDSQLVDSLIKENSYSSRSTRYLPPNEELVSYNQDSTILSEKLLTIDISKNEIWEQKVLPFIKDEEKKKCLKYVQKTYNVKAVELDMDEPMIDSEIYSIVFLPISSQTYQYSGAYYDTLTSGNKGKTVGQRPIGTGYVGGAIYDVVSKVSNIVQDSIGM